MDHKNILKFSNIAVIGLGKSGLSALRLLNLLEKDCTVINQGKVESWLPQGVEKHRAFAQEDPEAIEALSDCELVILSPGIPRDIELLKNFKGPIWCEIELASLFCDSQIIAITGTNGKTTTVSLLDEVFSNLAQQNHFVGGNIGTPFCDYAYELLSGARKRAKTVLLELSSFQLESLNSFKAHIAAVLNITFSHGERYNELSSYAMAKRNIFDNQKDHDFAIYPKGLWEELSLDYPTDGHQVALDLSSINSIKGELSQVCDLDKIKLFGNHNLLNIYFAYEIYKRTGLDVTAFKKGVESFGGVDYRLQYLGEFHGLKVFNDAKSTNWEATVTAIKGVMDLGQVHLVLGGQLRGEGDFQVERLKPFKDKISSVLLIGESGQQLKEHLSEFEYKLVSDINGVKKESENLQGVLLFSPAFPSFDQFANYVQRGRAFSDLFKSSDSL